MASTVFCPTELTLPETLFRTIPADAPASWDYAAAHGYCRHLARTHYENFHVGTWLFPKEAREHAFNFYAYCRWADDLADETGDPELSLRLLEWWRGQVVDCWEGRAEHPVFIALGTTVQRFGLPQQPFLDLIDAFVQDQTKMRYETWEEVIDYCARSANPVGRIVLRLLGYDDDERDLLSDHTCTALQLANHWQDIENDLRRGRIYVPREEMVRFEVNEEDLAMPVANDSVRALVAECVRRAREEFHRGAPLIGKVSGRARFDISLFTRGGLAILDAIEGQQCDVLARRPVVTRLRKVRLLLGALMGGRAA